MKTTTRSTKASCGCSSAIVPPLTAAPPALCSARFPDAGGLQHHGPHFRRNERRVDGAGLLQQLHRLQASQGFLHKPAHQVSAAANCYLRRAKSGDRSGCHYGSVPSPPRPYLLNSLIPSTVITHRNSSADTPGLSPAPFGKLVTLLFALAAFWGLGTKAKKEQKPGMFQMGLSAVLKKNKMSLLPKRFISLLVLATHPCRRQ